MRKNSIYLRKKTYKQTRLPTEKAVSLIPDAYTEEEFFELEKEQIFRRYWVVCILFQNAGDLMVAEIGGQSVISAEMNLVNCRLFIMSAVIAAVACLKRMEKLKKYSLPLRLGL